MPLGNVQLVVEYKDGTPVEYRINGGQIEARIPARRRDDKSAWERLTPRQVSIHVKGNTVVARWLENRLGWRRLLQACVAEEANSEGSERQYVGSVLAVNRAR